jgi:hypothetical protein
MVNVLDNVPAARIAPTASEIVAAFKAVWDSWGPRNGADPLQCNLGAYADRLRSIRNSIDQPID